MEIHFQITDHVVAVEKVAEHHIGTKLCSCNTFEDISHLLIDSQGTKLSQNSFGTTGLTTCGSYWSVRKFISPICKHENKKLLHGY